MVLKELIQENLSKEHLMEGVLHILHDYEYDEIPVINDFVIEQCYNHECKYTKYKLVSVFESWNNKESLEAIRKMFFETEWIEEYRLAVLKNLEEDNL